MSESHAGRVRAAPARDRQAFAFELTDAPVVSFTGRQLLLRAEKD